jgi:hypothetical protein
MKANPAMLRHVTRSVMTFALIMGLLAGPGLVFARDSDPFEVPLKHYAFFLAIAMIGGLVSWFAKVRAGTIQMYNLSGMIGELATSGFAGLLTFWLCAYWDVPQTLTAAAVGMAGHMGTKAIQEMEAWAERRFTSVADKVGP